MNLNFFLHDDRQAQNWSHPGWVSWFFGFYLRYRARVHEVFSVGSLRRRSPPGAHFRRLQARKKYSGWSRRLRWPNGGVWTRQNAFHGPRARGGGISHGVGGARAWRRFLKFSDSLKTQVFQFSPKSAKVLPPQYIWNPPPPTQSACARARNAKQNAPRTSTCPTRERVVRFVSRFSRAEDCGIFKVCGPQEQRGKDFGGCWGKLENPGFHVLGKSEKPAPGVGSPTSGSKSPPRTRGP